MDYRRMHTGRRWVATLVLLQSSGFPLDESSSVQSPRSLIVGAGDRNRTGTGLLSPRDFRSQEISPAIETIGRDRQLSAHFQLPADGILPLNRDAYEESEQDRASTLRPHLSKSAVRHTMLPRLHGGPTIGTRQSRMWECDWV
jgi:hypothetical protein